MATAKGRTSGKKQPANAANVIGVRLRQARQERGLSLRSLAAQVGVTASLLSQVETGHVNPSVDTLFGLSEALEVPACHFFEAHHVEGHHGPIGEPVGSGPVLHRAGRHALRLAHGVRWESLLLTEEPDFEWMEIIYPSGSISADTMQRHGGRDYFVVLEGTLTVTVAFATFHLGPGDSMAFDATMPHQLRNEGSNDARAIAVVLERHRPLGAHTSATLWNQAQRFGVASTPQTAREVP